MQKNLIDNLTKIIGKLPGMGPRIARRIILHLASEKSKTLNPLIENLQLLSTNIHKCKNCFNLDEGEICKICLDPKRDKNIICVVEEVSDVWAIERSKNFNGIYHILGGNLNAASGKTIEDLHINQLYDRLKQNQQINEVIIATSPTIDGQTTAHFLLNIFKEFSFKTTKLAHGIPVGSDLDYLDDGTIAVAFKTRSEF